MACTYITVLSHCHRGSNHHWHHCFVSSSSMAALEETSQICQCENLLLKEQLQVAMAALAAERTRTKPHLSVSDGQYKEALYSLLIADAPALDMRSKLGPHLATKQKQVTPGHLVTLAKL